MEKVYSDPALTALVTMAERKVHHINSRWYTPTLDKAQSALDKLGFSSHVQQYSLEYGQFILEFLEDPNRSGRYLLNGQRYAEAAVYFLVDISNHTEQIPPSNNTTKRKIERRKNLPWLWRKLVQQARSSESAQIVKWWPLEQEEMYITPYRRVYSEVSFRLAMIFLVHALPKSDISEELTALARRQKFGPLSRKDACRKKAVAREIARYLARVDAEDPLTE
ncbi:hypothetical protein GALMADRAFT_919068 [Galerina marginata CBS 339.88]|uniref:Uncharacterized protein n=1 Tax=Galerina marginata (strain CBS 339.88) TaxID=685588 RepID=A0A067SEP0_GALM3|nr:hypothetical protein GALMADRAFT_919068 [Galerina marginata CBS 339.88]